MEKARDGSFVRTTRKTAEDDEDEEDWNGTLNRYEPWAMFARSLASCFPIFSVRGEQNWVWRAREGTPSGIFPGASSSDVQTMWLSPSGQYLREIVVEGGDGATGAGGTIVDSGEYRLSRHKPFRYPPQLGSLHCWRLTANRAKHGDAALSAGWAGAIQFHWAALD